MLHLILPNIIALLVIGLIHIHFFDEPRKRKWFGTKVFQVVQNEYFKRGDVTKVEYFIQERCNILGRINWIDVTETVCDWGDCYESAVTFATKEEAQRYVDKICKSEIWKGNRETVVDTHKCS